jgi:deazaflavin-dependent oxidoreductase (nitroreductase family)
MDEALVAESFCYLTTTGRRTGRPHEIEIWFAVDDGAIYMLAGGGRRSDWVRNLIADERVGVRIASNRWQGRAAVVTGADDDGAARRLLASKYQGWRPGAPLSSWARSALLVRIELDDSP